MVSIYFQFIFEIYSDIFIERKGDCKRMLNSQSPRTVGLCIHNSTACSAYASAILMKFLGFPQSGYELKNYGLIRHMRITFLFVLRLEFYRARVTEYLQLFG